MWISRVDEVENNNDKVQLSNPFMMQNNMDHLRSPLNAGHASSGRAKASAVSPAGNDIGVVVTLSHAGNNPAPTYATTLSGIDMDLFAAD